jgi:hypothetical protein
MVMGTMEPGWLVLKHDQTTYYAKASGFSTTRPQAGH